MRLPLTSEKLAETRSRKTKTISGAQKNCPLDSFKPYQRPKLSDPAHEGVRLQPRRDGRVRCHDGLNAALLGDTLRGTVKPQPNALMKEYILKPIMMPTTLSTSATLDKPVVARSVPPRQPLPTAVKRRHRT